MQICRRVAMEAHVKISPWVKESREHQRRTADGLSLGLRPWVNRLIRERTGYCPLLKTLLPPLMQEEMLTYMVSWVLQAVLVGPLLDPHNSK